MNRCRHVPRTVLVAALLLPQAQALAQAPERGVYAVTNVSVIPMTEEIVLANQTVVIEGGTITAAGPASETFIPAGATRIDGRGRFVVPGIAEMHGHLPVDPADAADYLLLYLAGGATTVRGMQGHPNQLELRRRVEAGQLLGPRMWLAAPALNGNSAPDEATAERLVREAAADGYDLLKIHEGLSPPVYQRIVATARELGLPFGGHVPDDVGVDGALAAGQTTIDHLDNYIDAMQPRRSPAFAATGPERRRLMAVHADRERIEDLAAATLEAGVAVVPTQRLWQVFAGAHDPNVLARQPENRYMPPATVDDWYQRISATYNNSSRIAAERESGIRQQLLLAMNEEGVEILLGTDAPQVFSVPGFSLHREMALMAESGMTPYQVLLTGTVNVARHLGIADRAGTIVAGNQADLLLLDANPLEDIGAMSALAGVMADGRWLPREFIDARLEAIAARQRR